VNPYVFIVGCPRSGTTLVSRLADAHPQLAVMPEQHWLPRFWEARVGMTADGLVTSELPDWLLADRHFELLALPFAPLVELAERGVPISYGDFVSQLFNLYGSQRGKEFVGEKTPKYVNQLATLTDLWPDSRVVHLIRDGRDVALSLLEWSKAERNVGRFPGWADDPVTTAALFWEWSVRNGRDGAGRLGELRYREIRYEALIADPATPCASLCSFLALPYDARMLRFHEGHGRAHGTGRSAKKAWLPVTAGLRDWHTDMSAADVRRFEAAAGGLINELGYERAAVTSREERLHAERVRQRLIVYLQRWGRRVPRAWREEAA